MVALHTTIIIFDHATETCQNKNISVYKSYSFVWHYGGNCDVCVDPEKWTVEQTQSWVDWIIHEFDLKSFDVSQYNLTGQQLCSLSKEEFSVTFTTIHRRCVVCSLTDLKKR